MFTSTAVSMMSFSHFQQSLTLTRDTFFCLSFLCLIAFQTSIKAHGDALDKDDNLQSDVTIATFNVSMESQNYIDRNTNKSSETSSVAGSQLGPQVLMRYLESGEHPQIQNIAEIIQHTQPDVILLNEFDYIDNPEKGVKAFIKNYLNVSQAGAAPIDYPYYFYTPSNTGLPTTFDLDNNGKRENFGGDAQGYGLYSGHYAMVLLSRYPIDTAKARTFQRFLWSDMPDALMPVDPETNTAFYNDIEWANLRLSSKSHWDIPININGKTLHVLASHPTPPVFDGKEDRNGRRNHDEIRLWLDYITPGKSEYLYDDNGQTGGLSSDANFVILGDQNASPDRPNDTKSVITELLNSPYVNNTFTPKSTAGKQNKPESDYSQYHTASWASRADYVIPSKDIEIVDGAVFWPDEKSELYRLVKDRASSSDHRLVWLRVKLK